MESMYGTFSPTKDYKLVTFRKDIKELIINAGIYQKRVCLVLTDNNVTQNFILEDVNSLLNNGEIANLLDSVINLLI
jgi:dynein heavy chain